MWSSTHSTPASPFFVSLSTPRLQPCCHTANTFPLTGHGSPLVAPHGRRLTDRTTSSRPHRLMPQPHVASKRPLLHVADVTHRPLQGGPRSEPRPLLRRILLHLCLFLSLSLRYLLSIHACLFYLSILPLAIVAYHSHLSLPLLSQTSQRFSKISRLWTRYSWSASPCESIASIFSFFPSLLI